MVYYFKSTRTEVKLDFQIAFTGSGIHCGAGPSVLVGPEARIKLLKNFLKDRKIAVKEISKTEIKLPQNEVKINLTLGVIEFYDIVKGEALVADPATFFD